MVVALIIFMLIGLGLWLITNALEDSAVKDVVIEYLDGNPYMLKKNKLHDACYDIYLPKTYILKSGRQIIPAGFKIKLPVGYTALVCPRSGCDAKGFPVTITHADGTTETDVRISADVKQGIVDCGYANEVGVILNNHHRSKKGDVVSISEGFNVAQLLIIKLPEVTLVDGIVPADTERGLDGFGSSDVKPTI